MVIWKFWSPKKIIHFVWYHHMSCITENKFNTLFRACYLLHSHKCLFPVIYLRKRFFLSKKSTGNTPQNSTTVNKVPIPYLYNTFLLVSMNSIFLLIIRRYHFSWFFVGNFFKLHNNENYVNILSYTQTLWYRKDCNHTLFLFYFITLCITAKIKNKFPFPVFLVFYGLTSFIVQKKKNNSLFMCLWYFLLSFNFLSI